MERRLNLNDHRHVKRFQLALLVILTLVTIAVFIGLMMRTSALVQDRALEQARAYTDLLITTRSWNADKGGVYVRKSDHVTTNPYLVELGIDADDTLSDGTPITLRNPSVMTREIGEMLPFAASGAGFKLTSLKPVNPTNSPDEWERAALVLFEQGLREQWKAPAVNGANAQFRYMRPLLVESACLDCHGAQDYRVGDIRGALSVTLPYEATARALKQNRNALSAVAFLVLVGLWAMILGSIGWLEKQLAAANQRLEHMATTDELTGVWNRRYVLDRLEQESERSRRRGNRVGVILADIDHFKLVNDSYGHSAGDEVLRGTADAIRAAVRSYDTVGRIGGEEFLVVAPDIDAVSLTALAERIRAGVESTIPSGQPSADSVTISVGTALTEAEPPESPDVLVSRADAAMYAAKDAGRNRVVAG